LCHYSLKIYKILNKQKQNQMGHTYIPTETFSILSNFCFNPNEKKKNES
jgi:hypothetical protein